MRRLLTAATLLMLAPLAIAQVYKWTDSAGTVHYAEAPPAAGTQYERVKTNGSVEPLVAPASRENSETPQEITSTPAEPVADTAENRASLCTSLQANLATLQGAGPVVMEKDGKSVALDQSQRDQQISAAQDQYQQYCQPS